jgi:mono/diheme cytochrome c family protein
MGPDGALYISDDKRGRIWRVTSHDAANAALAPAPTPVVANAATGNAGPLEGKHPNAGRSISASLPVPPGATKEQVALGERIFQGEAADGTCAGCHGSDANGSPVAPSLVNGVWFFGDGSLKAITQTIADGVPRPRNYSNAPERLIVEMADDLVDPDQPFVMQPIEAVKEVGHDLFRGAPMLIGQDLHCVRLIEVETR